VKCPRGTAKHPINKSKKQKILVSVGFWGQPILLGVGFEHVAEKDGVRSSEKENSA
jgi:hypothetical protein